jgi:DNA helicase II / ATP-dependent DNA helicase PcrA
LKKSKHFDFDSRVFSYSIAVSFFIIVDMDLNEKQKEAVVQIQGPLLIIAGAGSWKTATLTARIAAMIGEHRISPSSILAVTFTNKAAAEMKQRVWIATGIDLSPSFGGMTRKPYIGTFHSFWVFLLKRFIPHPWVFEKIGLKKDFLIYDEGDKLSLMKTIVVGEMWLIEKEFPPRQIAYFISDAKNKCISSQEYEEQADSNIKEVVAEAYKKYEKKLEQNNALDFDDILWKSLKLLEIPEILSILQEQYRYIMVDEYQDTNIPQYNIIKLLAEKYKNLAVVGDDWQSIYSWRGADMRNILNFKKDYPEALVVKLEQNYRSTKNIVSAANKVIKYNIEALDKTLWTEKPHGEKIYYFEAATDSWEANFIAETIEEKVKKWGFYKDNLILYRTNAQSRKLEEALLYKTIPYRVIWGLKFYERKEIKDMLAYLRILHNPSDSVSFKRIINVPGRKIGDTSLWILDSYANTYSLIYPQILENIDEVEELRSGAKSALSGFYDIYRVLCEKSQNLDVKNLLEEIIADIGYHAYLKINFSQDEYNAKIENLTELLNVTSEYRGLDPRESLAQFLEEVALITDMDSKDEREDYVTMMTIHTAKWLEQMRVFVAGLEDWVFPHSRTFSSQKELEEERRLMYVAMTRAREELYLTRAGERFYFGDYIRNPASRFLKEIPEEYLEVISQKIDTNFFHNSFSFWETDAIIPAIKKPTQINDVTQFHVWDKIEHHKFGTGIILSMVWDLSEIHFSSCGTKKMNIKIAPVKKV